MVDVLDAFLGMLGADLVGLVLVAAGKRCQGKFQVE
jgi:hypothetical protein